MRTDEVERLMKQYAEQARNGTLVGIPLRALQSLEGGQRLTKGQICDRIEEN